MKKIFFTLLMLCMVSFLWAAGAQEDTTTEPVSTVITVTDSYGRTVTLPEPAKRVVSIAPNVTETLFALGKGDILAGRTDYCDYPVEAKNIKSIGTLTEPNIEVIADMSPNLVIASTHFTKEALESLEDIGIRVVILKEQDSFDGVYNTINIIGKLTASEDAALKLITKMKATVTDVISRTASAEKPTVYYVIGFGEYGDFTAGGDTFIGQIIDMAGGVNITADLNGWSYSLENIVEKNPDIIICSKHWEAKKGLMNTNGYKNLPAIKEERLFEIDNNMLDRQGPRLAQGLKAMAEILHPDLF